MEKIKDNNKEIILKYSILGRILSLCSRIITLYMGIVLLLMGMAKIWFGILGIVFIAYSICMFIDTLLFKELRITSDKLIKEWNNGKKIIISMDELVVSKSNFTIGGIISFKTNKNKLISFLTKVYMLPLGDENIKKLKEILIINKVLKGDEFEWID